MAADNGEDGWFVRRFPRDFVGYAAEVGVFDGVTGSNTHLLEQAGWTVLSIEANPTFEAAIRSHRTLVSMVACSDHQAESEDFHVYMPGPSGYSSLYPVHTHPVWHPDPGAAWEIFKVPVRTVDSLLDEFNFPRLDVLSIDAEGHDLAVLKGSNLARWKPKAVVAECWDEGENEVVRFMIGSHYRHVGRLGVNELFERDE